jgi:16S rRNA (guanine527-N7)-methyltransferase
MEDSKMLDFGTGAGFPGIILSIYFESNQMALLDSSRKKSLFLKQLISKLDLNAEVICERIENLTTHSDKKFDIIVARAVAPTTKLVSLSFPLLENNGALYTHKGLNYKDEIQNDISKTVKLSKLKNIKTWMEFSPFLKNKIMLKLEHKNA